MGNGAALRVGCDTVRKEEDHEAGRLISFFLKKLLSG
jgi:hypothetical protein